MFNTLNAVQFISLVQIR